MMQLKDPFPVPLQHDPWSQSHHIIHVKYHQHW